jgi:prepilin signal peptidase PulO-like enzyme (type II secretory pathway)
MNVGWLLDLGSFAALFVVLAMAFFAVSVFIVDLEHQYIPDFLVFGLLVLVIGLFFITSNPLIFSYLAAGFGASVFLLLLNLLTLGRGMGLGDVKLAIALGAILGFPLSVVFMFTSFILGSVLGLALMAFGRAKLHQKIAFGPFLIVGFALTALYGFEILAFWGF